MEESGRKRLRPQFSSEKFWAIPICKKSIKFKYLCCAQLVTGSILKASTLGAKCVPGVNKKMYLEVWQLEVVSHLYSRHQVPLRGDLSGSTQSYHKKGI